MRKAFRVFLGLSALLALPTLDWQLSTAFAQGTAFTYQGRLNDSGAPANGIYDLRFGIYDSTAPGGNQIGGFLTNSATTVSNGLFTATMDFGPGIFTGDSRWLDIAVRTNGSVAFMELSPRQPMAPAPYAIMAGNASNLLGVLPAGQLSGAIGNNNLPASGTFSGAVTANSFSGNGSGLTNLNATKLASGTVPDARLSGNVAFLNVSQTFAGATTFSNDTTTFGTTVGSLAVINDLGVVPGITVTGGLAPGHLRFRNALEVWPNSAATAGGYLDVRDTNGSPEITLTGAGGTITANAFSGDGSSLTGLNASQLSSGTIPLAQLPAAIVTNNESSPITLGAVTASSVSVTNQVRLNDQPLYLRSASDANHGLAYSGTTITNFGNGNAQVDGPVLWGFTGGALAVLDGGAHPVLNWSNGGVTINGTLFGDGSGLTNTTTAANYIYAYDTTTQTSSPETTQSITFNTTPYISGWTHTNGTAQFICHQNGLYSIDYNASVFMDVTNGVTEVTFWALDNGYVITGSDAYVTHYDIADVDNPYLDMVSRHLIASFNSNDVLSFSFSWGGGNVMRITPANYISVSCTVVRIQ